jgi:hypothetical protein
MKYTLNLKLSVHGQYPEILSVDRMELKNGGTYELSDAQKAALESMYPNCFSEASGEHTKPKGRPPKGSKTTNEVDKLLEEINKGEYDDPEVLAALAEENQGSKVITDAIASRMSGLK